MTISAISRWYVTVLKNTGVDVTVFVSHSTRSASTAHSKRKELSMKKINKAAGWLSSKMFAKHYKKQIVYERGSFSRNVLLESWSCKYIIRAVVFIKYTGVNIYILSLYQ